MRRPGPKRLLALDGGGIRGLISLEVLAELEQQLREQLGAGKDFVLADYFDYIAGTSTGAIIGTLLSLGWAVDPIRSFYLEHGKEIFRKAIAPWRLYRALFRETGLSARLRSLIGSETTLGTDKLRTLLLLVLRNADTDSPWPLCNNPAAKYNRPGHEGRNLDLPLWQLVRASAAAPLLFQPESIKVGQRSYRFVDGGMTSYNNPAFLLFLMATLAPYHLGWPVGEDRLLVVSVGTGTNPRPEGSASPNLYTATFSVLMDPRFAALVEQDFLCRVFGHCLVGDPIDNEVGDLKDPRATPFAKLFTYLRYNAELSRKGLTALRIPDVDPEAVNKMASLSHTSELRQVGRAIAESQVRMEHFTGFLDDGAGTRQS